MHDRCKNLSNLSKRQLGNLIIQNAKTSVIHHQKKTMKAPILRSCLALCEETKPPKKYIKERIKLGLKSEFYLFNFA